jgi:hypothetical protein
LTVAFRRRFYGEIGSLVGKPILPGANLYDHCLAQLIRPYDAIGSVESLTAFCDMGQLRVRQADRRVCVGRNRDVELELFVPKLPR